MGFLKSVDNYSLLRKIAVVGMAVALTLGCVGVAVADDDLEALSKKVDETSKKYDEAIAEQKYVNSEIEKLEKRIAENEAELPQLQKNADTAVVSLYKMGRNNEGLLDMILDSNSFADALSIVESYDNIYNHYANDIRKNKDTQAQLESDKLALDEKKTMADLAVIESERALEEAKEARQKAQEEAEARAAAQARQASALADKELASQIDWTMSKDEFVSHWGKRIDDYLAGSPLDGYGTLFAESAWNNGADPRLSPAISCVESSKARNCFRSFNCWGWMQHSFSSWEEAIPAHVAYIASNIYPAPYLSYEFAEIYCVPPDSWYEKVGTEMRKI